MALAARAELHTHKWLQELIAANCNGLLGAVVYMLSGSITAIKTLAQQYCLPSSEIPRAALPVAVLEVEKRCVWLQTMGIDILRCLREPALRSSMDAPSLLEALTQHILLQVMPNST
jgi:hypothetical protein